MFERESWFIHEPSDPVSYNQTRWTTSSTLPVDDLPGVGQVSYDLHGDEHLLLDVDGADHLMEELPGVGQELAHLQVGLQLMELLDLKQGKDKGYDVEHPFLQVMDGSAFSRPVALLSCDTQCSSLIPQRT